jgi:hypothetical protein
MAVRFHAALSGCCAKIEYRCRGSLLAIAYHEARPGIQPPMHVSISNSPNTRAHSLFKLTNCSYCASMVRVFERAGVARLVLKFKASLQHLHLVRFRDITSDQTSISFNAELFVPRRVNKDSTIFPLFTLASYCLRFVFILESIAQQ